MDTSYDIIIFQKTINRFSRLIVDHLDFLGAFFFFLVSALPVGSLPVGSAASCAGRLRLSRGFVADAEGFAGADLCLAEALGFTVLRALRRHGAGMCVIFERFKI